MTQFPQKNFLLIMLKGWKQTHGTKLLEVLGGNGEVTDD